MKMQWASHQLQQEEEVGRLRALRRIIRGSSLGGRLMDRDGDGHPYAGAGFGGTRYVHSGGHVYLEAGLRYDIADRWGAEFRLSADIIGEGDSVGGAHIPAA